MPQTMDEIRAEIDKLIPYEQFVQIQSRLAELRREEQEKLHALAELQQMYVAAASEYEQEQVKAMVGKIRELSRTSREEIRALNQQLSNHMSLAQAKELYEKLMNAQQ